MAMMATGFFLSRDGGTSMSPCLRNVRMLEPKKPPLFFRFEGHKKKEARTEGAASAQASSELQPI